MTNTGKVNIRGKEYLTVAYRIKQFRVDHPDWQIHTDIIKMDDDRVVVRAEIADSAGVTVATGHAEEKRSASQINQTSALENCESSAVGRAWPLRDTVVLRLLVRTKYRTLSTSRRTRTRE
jgi:hypothetical protein